MRLSRVADISGIEFESRGAGVMAAEGGGVKETAKIKAGAGV